MRYVATFPLLLNIADQPTYFMALKGEDGLVKMYAMVNVQQYNIVETGGTVAECEANYRRTLADNGLISDSESEAAPSDQEEASGVVAEIRTAVLDGNSYYFLRLEGQETLLRRQCRGKSPGGDPECRGSGDDRLHRRRVRRHSLRHLRRPGRRDPRDLHRPEEDAS